MNLMIISDKMPVNLLYAVIKGVINNMTDFNAKN